MYRIDIEEFQGPLELLNHLIEKNKIDIYDIPISEITDQYIEYIEAMKELNLDVTSEFIVIASNLLVIKSKMLLPKAPEEEDPREELVSKILEYRKFKLVSEQIKERAGKYSKIYYKLKEDIEYIDDSEELDFDIGKLVEAYKKVLSKIESGEGTEDEKTEDLVRNIKRDEFSVEEGIEYIEKRLESEKRLEFTDFFDGRATKYRIVTIFMAMLELIKRKRIKVVQESLFGDIIITKLGNNNNEYGGEPENKPEE